MKLNIECVRDILLTVENNDFDSPITLDSLHHKLPEYSIEDLHYCCLKLNEGGYLDILTLNMMGHNLLQIKNINDLTFQGHEFLSSIKSENTWNKTKNIARKIGSFSLDALKDISAQVISNLINSNL